jgi:hypothetical protein
MKDISNGVFLPRGIRNNNPGNIRLSGVKWQGQKPQQADVSFVEFTEPVFGLRALMRLLLTYYLKYRLDTVESIINRFAPPYENATDHYIFSVARRMGVSRCAALEVTAKPVLLSLARAIVLHENGRPPQGRPPCWYDNGVYEAAADLALNEQKGKKP